MIRERSRLPPWAEQARFGGPISLDWPIFGTLSTAAGFAEAVNRAADYVALHGAGKGNTILIPPGTYDMAATKYVADVHTITGITQADPGVVTYTGTDPVNGTIILITDIVGMTEVNGIFFTVANVNTVSNTFELTDEDGENVDTTGYTAYSSDGKWRTVTDNAAEGAGVFLLPKHSNIVWQGAGRGLTTIKPSTNKIELFSILGAANNSFFGITFDNSDNGVLQHQVKPGGHVPGGGALGNGNSGNIAIRLHYGDDLTVEGCAFLAWRFGVNYLNDIVDPNNLSGTIRFVDNICDGGVTGLMATQAAHVVCDDNWQLNSINSYNFSGSHDNGHLVYIPNADKAHCLTVQCNNNRAYNTSDVFIKMRKGIRQVAVGNIGHNVQGGIVSQRAESFVISGNVIGMFTHPTLPSAYSSGILITGCIRGGIVADNAIDKSGTSNFGIRAKPPGYEPDDDDDSDTDGTSTVPARNVLYINNQIFDDFSGTDAKNNFIHIIGQIGGEVRGNKAIVTGDVAVDQAVFLAKDCTGLKFWDNTRNAEEVGNPVGSDRLYSIDSDCEDTVIGWCRENLGRSQAPSPSQTILDAGTNTRVVRIDGVTTEEWTPVPNFATNPAGAGQFVPANVTAVGWLQKQGDMILAAGCRLKFDTNAYTTASGTFKITGFPYTADTFGSEFVAAVAYHKNLGTSSDSIGAVIANNENVFTLKSNIHATAGNVLSTTQIPASTTNIEIGFQIAGVRIDET